jgi:uncharacterized membrane protein YhaH (DUF805 family)
MPDGTRLIYHLRTQQEDERVNDIDWGTLLFKFDGRINRAKFWAGLVMIWVVPWFLMTVAVVLNSWVIGWIGIVTYIVTLWPAIALNIKRWHDRDKSGWWILIGLIPIVGTIWALIETGFLAGTAGPNRYGPDPLGFG